jgi:mersacidin/lichenicidin family type 2 lantibiotic
MPNEDIIRAWKDENYFHELSKEARANIPKNPAGELQELSPEEMSQVIGGKEAAGLVGGRLTNRVSECAAGTAISVRGECVSIFNCHSVVTKQELCAPNVTRPDICMSAITAWNHTARGCHNSSRYHCYKF